MVVWYWGDLDGTQRAALLAPKERLDGHRVYNESVEKDERCDCFEGRCRQTEGEENATEMHFAKIARCICCQGEASPDRTNLVRQMTIRCFTQDCGAAADSKSSSAESSRIAQISRSGTTCETSSLYYMPILGVQLPLVTVQHRFC